MPEKLFRGLKERVLGNEEYNKRKVMRNEGMGVKNLTMLDRLANILAEKGLPEKILRVLQNPAYNPEQREELIKKILFNNNAISDIFNIKNLGPKDQQIVFRTLFSIAIKILKNRGNISVDSRVGQPIIKRAPSYVGVCDVLSPKVARAFIHDFKKYSRDPNRKLMIGVMTSPVILDPNLPVPKEVRDEINETFPKRENMADGFIDDPIVLNTIHYADLYGPRGPWAAKEAPNILKNLELCVKYGGKYLHAIQLDVNWPDPNALKVFRAKYPNISIVLQVGKFALKACNNNPQEVANRLKEYNNSVDHVLLDMSMGKGKAMISADLLPLLREIKSKIPDMGLVVAGGFGPEISNELKQVALEFPDVSIDAQGRLKPDYTKRDSLGHLLSTYSADFGKTRKYIKHSSGMLD